MKNNNELFAVDTNILVYAQGDNDPRKMARAEEILGRGKPVIADRVVFEFLNVIRRKYNFHDVKHHGVFDICLPFFEQCTIQPITLQTIQHARKLTFEYPLQLFDSVILAASAEAGCTVIYSEDMEHKKVIEEQLTIINPFE